MSISLARDLQFSSSMDFVYDLESSLAYIQQRKDDANYLCAELAQGGNSTSYIKLECVMGKESVTWVVQGQRVGDPRIVCRHYMCALAYILARFW